MLLKFAIRGPRIRTRVGVRHALLRCKAVFFDPEMLQNKLRFINTNIYFCGLHIPLERRQREQHQQSRLECGLPHYSNQSINEMQSIIMERILAGMRWLWRSQPRQHRRRFPWGISCSATVLELGPTLQGRVTIKGWNVASGPLVYMSLNTFMCLCLPNGNTSQFPSD